MASRLALALDVATVAELESWRDRMAGLPLVFKVGLRVLPLLGDRDLRGLREAGFGIFIDAKLHDIPSQVRGAVETWAARDVDYLTLHLSGGRKMLEEAVAGARANPRLRLLGVSVLTSLSGADLSSLGFTPDPSEQVRRLAKLGLESGLPSFVSSVGELGTIRAMAAEAFSGTQTFSCCPGITLDGGQAPADQSRTFSVTEALREKVDLLVMGRAILGASDPRAVAETLVRRLESEKA
jgi:orotidine-5'-phosphate decarboxylase